MRLYGEQAKALREALARDVDDCDECQQGTPVPHAAYTWVRPDEDVGNTYRCRSFCRWYNPDTGKMEGRAHCTCDSCW